MKRYLRGTVLLAATAGVWACSGDPTSGLQDDSLGLKASPSSIFVTAGDSTLVTVSLTNATGGTTEAAFTATAQGPAVVVVEDPDFRAVYNADGTLTRPAIANTTRFYVRGVSSAATTVTVAANGETLSIPVKVIPSSTTPTVSKATPGIGEAVTITSEAGLAFTANSRLVSSTGALQGYTLSVAPDGSTMDVVMKTGATGTFSITNIAPSYGPDLRFTVPSSVTITPTATSVGFAGVGALATAPSLYELNTESAAVGITDVGTSWPFAAATIGVDGGFRVYKLVVTETGSYDLGVKPSSAADLALVVYDAAGLYTGIHADDLGAVTTEEKTTEQAIAAGTYYVGIGIFSGGTNPASFDVTIAPH
jgi:hypothetical protein